MVVKSGEVKQAVDEVTDQFALPGRAESTRLAQGLVEANKDLTVQGTGLRLAPRRLGIIEGNDVRSTFVPNESLIELCDFIRVREANAQIDGYARPKLIEEQPENGPEAAQVN